MVRQLDLFKVFTVSILFFLNGNAWGYSKYLVTEQSLVREYNFSGVILWVYCVNPLEPDPDKQIAEFYYREGGVKEYLALEKEKQDRRIQLIIEGNVNDRLRDYGLLTQNLDELIVDGKDYDHLQDLLKNRNPVDFGNSPFIGHIKGCKTERQNLPIKEFILKNSKKSFYFSRPSEMNRLQCGSVVKVQYCVTP